MLRSVAQILKNARGHKPAEQPPSPQENDSRILSKTTPLTNEGSNMKPVIAIDITSNQLGAGKTTLAERIEEMLSTGTDTATLLNHDNQLSQETMLERIAVEAAKPYVHRVVVITDGGHFYKQETTKDSSSISVQECLREQDRLAKANAKLRREFDEYMKSLAENVGVDMESYALSAENGNNRLRRAVLIQEKINELKGELPCGHPIQALGRVSPEDQSEEIHCLWCGDIKDLEFITENVSRVYDHVTGGKFSKVMTKASAVIAACDDYHQKICEDHLKEAEETIKQLQKTKNEAKTATIERLRKEKSTQKETIERLQSDVERIRGKNERLAKRVDELKALKIELSTAMNQRDQLQAKLDAIDDPASKSVDNQIEFSPRFKFVIPDVMKIEENNGNVRIEDTVANYWHEHRSESIEAQAFVLLFREIQRTNHNFQKVLKGKREQEQFKKEAMTDNKRLNEKLKQRDEEIEALQKEVKREADLADHQADGVASWAEKFYKVEDENKKLKAELAALYERDSKPDAPARGECVAHSQKASNVESVLSTEPLYWFKGHGGGAVAGQSDPVNHPKHYNKGNIEVIDFIDDQELNFDLGNAVKYICRADQKGKQIEDLEKAAWYLNHEIELLKKNAVENKEVKTTVKVPVKSDNVEKSPFEFRSGSGRLGAGIGDLGKLAAVLANRMVTNSASAVVCIKKREHFNRISNLLLDACDTLKLGYVRDHQNRTVCIRKFAGTESKEALVIFVLDGERIDGMTTNYFLDARKL